MLQRYLQKISEFTYRQVLHNYPGRRRNSLADTNNADKRAETMLFPTTEVTANQ